MARDTGPSVKAILGVLAAVSSSGQHEAGALTVPLDWFRWLPASATLLFRHGLAVPPDAGLKGLPQRMQLLRESPDVIPTTPIDRAIGERLAAVDRIRPEQRALRAGFLFVAGRRQMGDRRPQRVFHPLLSAPVRITVPPLVGMATVHSAGDVTVTELVGDAAVRHDLEARYEVGGGALTDIASAVIPAAFLARLSRLKTFALEAARAAGFEVTGVVAADRSPEEFLRDEGLVVVVGVGLFTATDVGGLSAAESLRSWSERVGREHTAFEAVYLPGTGPVDSTAETEFGGPLSAYPLTPSQRRAVLASRHQPVSVVSGAAGNGKSHSVVAIACDAIARGESILLAAKSDAAVDALVVLLGAAPGPGPVVFGSSERREELARRLAAGELQPAPDDEVAAALEKLELLRRAHARMVADIVTRLQAEADLEVGDSAIDDARLVAPRLFDPSCDVVLAARLAAEACKPQAWWRRRHHRQVVGELLALTGASVEDLGELDRAISAAVRARAAGDLVAAGGIDLASSWERLETTGADLHNLAGRYLSIASRSRQRLNRSTLAAVAVLATALRAGRAVRRTQLLGLDQRLTQALPLWIGTLADIEDLLPAREALFDVVVLDEASAIDQPLAATALLRARRAVVVGDPHQLRHVSFLSDEHLQGVIRQHGIDDHMLASRLDVRRNSIFDVAVSTNPAVVLDEHFRSDPHLVDFVARRLYGGRFSVATRTPATDQCDCIDVVRLSAARDSGGVVREEVGAVVDLLRRKLAAGERSVGVISPFRAQADALERAVLDAFTLDELDRLDLRVGTVHAFQGNERDSVVVSLGVGTDGGPRTWQFVNDPHLFAVLASRARKRMTMMLSAEPPPGLAADYLAQADSPPQRPRPEKPQSAWTAGIAADLGSAGFTTITSYPCGRHLVDVCVAGERGFVGIECTVHPDGPLAHIERHMSLRRSGWPLIGAFASQRRGQRAEVVIELTGVLRAVVER